MLTPIKKQILLLVILHSSTIALCQDWKSLGADELFKVAQQEAFNEERESARIKLNYILKSNPEYEDVRILLGRTYAWDNQYDSARIQLQKVLKESPKYRDAINALVDVEMWSNQYPEALKTVNLGLKYHPTFSDFLYKKASILSSLERYQEAMVAINQLLKIDPGGERALTLRNSLETKQMHYEAEVRFATDLFSETFDPAYFSSAQLTRSNNWGPSILRINYASRFETSGFQGEVDLYPSIADELYGYLNYGYSGSSLFPEHRFGAEVFSTLVKNFEASAGFRHLRFETPVTIYTGSIGWYHKSIWLSFRPFIIPGKSAGTSVSGSLTLRRYFGSPNNYLELSGNIGFSPDTRTTPNGLGQEDIFILKTQRVSARFQHQLHQQWSYTLGFDLTRQERATGVENYLLITRLSSSFIFRF